MYLLYLCSNFFFSFSVNPERLMIFSIQFVEAALNTGHQRKLEDFLVEKCYSIGAVCFNYYIIYYLLTRNKLVAPDWECAAVSVVDTPHCIHALCLPFASS